MREEDDNSQGELAQRIERLYRERFPEGLIRRLEANFGPIGTRAEDAVYEGVEKVLRDGERLGVRDPADYITAIAFNFVKRELRRDQREELYDEVPEPPPFEEDDNAKALFASLTTIIDGWENRNMKIVTKLVIEAAFLGEHLTSDELAELASDIAGEELSMSSVWKWKERGLDRLATDVVELGLAARREKEMS